MSWSIQKSGSKEDAQKYLDEEAPKALSHVTGVERTLADQALGLARAAVEANRDTDKWNSTVTGYGSASFDGQGNQLTQSVSITVGLTKQIRLFD